MYIYMYTYVFTVQYIYISVNFPNNAAERKTQAKHCSANVVDDSCSTTLTAGEFLSSTVIRENNKRVIEGSEKLRRIS